MCGVAGIFAYGSAAPPIDTDRLQRMREAMALRGPDGAGTWIAGDRRIGLAHRRLAIIDLSDAGAQPMHSVDGKLAITFNGEIYNYRALMAELEQKGAKFRSNCDTEVLLHLYAAYGRDMVHKLRGMYAFAIWDAERQGLFAARDPFGIKPLYLADDGATLAFASQVKALTAGGGVDTRADPGGLAGFHIFGYVPEPFTFHRGVRALGSGSTFWIDRSGRKETRVHFDMTAEIGAAEQNAPGASARDGEALRAALADSIAHHLIADVPVGVFLSAGLDSATMTALAAEVHGQSVRTVTLAFDEYRGRREDEAPLAETVARRYGATHQTRLLHREDFAAELDTVLAAMDQPSIDGVNTYFVSKVTAATGLKVALSGLGGDELFGGYSTFTEVPRLVRALRPLRSARGLGRALRRLTHPLFRRIASPKYAGLLEYGVDYPGAYLLRRALHMPWELDGLLGRDFARAGLEALDLQGSLAATVRGISSPRLKMTALETQWYMRNQLLRDSDWAGMAHSLEIRTPLVDVALFRQLLPLLVTEHPPTKQAMARTPRIPLPPEVLGRAKTGFLVPVREWIARGNPETAAARGYRGWAGLVAARFTPDDGPGVVTDPARRVLIYRLGSLGDTIVALPSFRLIARRFPTAECGALTNFPIARVEAPIESILGESGLARGYFAYPLGTRQLRELWALRRSIAAWTPEAAVYLKQAGKPWETLRDAAFLVLCGVRHIYGLPFARNKREHGAAEHGLWEAEASRLARCLASLGHASLNDPRSWELGFTPEERAEADRLLAGWPQAARFIVLAPGTKVPFKDWGEGGWNDVLATMGRRYADLGLAFVGAEDDRPRAERLAAHWPGATLNFCGRVSPRISGLIIARALVFLGLDSGPMHLASSVRTPATVVFAKHRPPGIWFPHGAIHRVFYPGLSWSGGEPPVFRNADGEQSIYDIPADQVVESCLGQIAQRLAAVSRRAASHATGAESALT